MESQRPATLDVDFWIQISRFWLVFRIFVDFFSIEMESVNILVEKFKKDGFVIIENAVPVEIVDILRDKMIEDVEAILNRDVVPFNFNKGNIQQTAPTFPPYLFREVLYNEKAIAVTKALLGKKVKNVMYSGKQKHYLNIIKLVLYITE